MAASLYPVEEGLVASLARPGGNITGLAVFTPELMEKRVQIADCRYSLAWLCA